MNKIIDQFYLDVPRLNLFLEGSECSKDPDYVRDYLYAKLKPMDAFITIHTLTQTFLANYYIDEFKKVSINNQQLLDSNGYSVSIDTKKKLVHISKEFKIVYFSENYGSGDYMDYMDYLVDISTLSIVVCLEDMNIFYSWNYEFEVSEPLIINSCVLKI